MPSVLADGKGADKLNLKNAIEHYKALFKQNPIEKYRDAIRDCYIERATQLSQKKMYREAVVLWENHRKYCTSCNHHYLYINLALASRLENKAATAFVENSHTLNEGEASVLEEIFAALLIGASDELLHIFPENSIQRTHLIFANQALAALASGNGDEALRALNSIPFRFPTETHPITSSLKSSRI